MKMINNYLNSFESYLPEDTKTEVRAELESSILEQTDDMESELGRQLNQLEQEQLLLKIGHPMRVAAAYLPNQELINKDFYPAYKKSLYTALTVFGVLTILLIVPFNLFKGEVIGSLISIVSSLLETGVWVFASVTFIFYLMQKNGVSLEQIYAWSPKHLKYSVKKVPLSRFETGFEMIFEGLFLIWWNNLFNAESLIIDSELVQNISMSPEWQSVFWVVNVSVGVSILLNFYKLIVSAWNNISIVTNIIIAIADIVIILFILQFEQLIVIESVEIGSLDWKVIGWTIQFNIKIFLTIISMMAVWDIYSGVKKLRA